MWTPKIDDYRVRVGGFLLLISQISPLAATSCHALGIGMGVKGWLPRDFPVRAPSLALGVSREDNPSEKVVGEAPHFF